MDKVTVVVRVSREVVDKIGPWYSRKTIKSRKVWYPTVHLHIEPGEGVRLAQVETKQEMPEDAQMEAIRLALEELDEVKDSRGGPLGLGVGYEFPRVNLGDAGRD